jgi:pimeloyl-ACP methyl ester carboxylesterase
MSTYKEPIYSQAYMDVGRGPVVILLHGLFGNLAMWRPTIQALQENYRVIVPRLPFFGEPIFRTHVDNLVNALADFIDWHQLSDVTLVGTDLGGQVALCYADRFRGQVRQLVLSGSSGLTENIVYSMDYSSIRDQIQQVFYQNKFASFHLVNSVYQTMNTSINGLHVKYFTQSSQETEVSDILRELSHPVLLVWGLQDKITTPEVALQFHDLLQHGTVRFIDSCGHLPMVERPEEYTAHLLAFLQRPCHEDQAVLD